MSLASNTVLLDTNIVSYLYKRDTRADLYYPLIADATPVLSFQTIAELDAWTIKARWGERAIAELNAYLERYAVVEHSRRISRCWAEAKIDTGRRGRPMTGEDLWIAATALALEIPLVTHNAADFTGLSELEVLTA